MILLPLFTVTSKLRLKSMVQKPAGVFSNVELISTVGLIKVHWALRFNEDVKSVTIKVTRSVKFFIV